ncbi:Thioesterase/thiol ester dehydrase-isomerase [Suhomyces tanzawaensis NRRL Y-17324]|uniref:Thioesterase/thiol ester dehydrase-isomerase n=1 Tax=Suhomyces tanzawaensis NRRL Y-17324 TaxID=984487 RepID=A0A1E4SB43_9ASCO|nr:Thioesterase/thiol ester dehydrase-isomerase [Suhomyces tanzawaensis NRRL Y-17324]ODV76622.1 Thioesterase/thiol ester dehydrase-isomerase [Suhomyces tanzawaensis NRRL Y-17324]
MDFEEALRVIRVDDSHFVGAHPLRLPIAGARGVFGGNTIGQTLLVAIESTKHHTDGYLWTPTAFHLYFIRAGDARVPMEYKVDLFEGKNGTIYRSIVALQHGKVRATASCTFVRLGLKLEDHGGPAPPPLLLKYPDPSQLYQTHHTSYIRSAYSDEFLDYRLTPEEEALPAADRKITYQQLVKNPVYNFVGMGVISDSLLLTTLPRILHLPWNPTENRAVDEYDAGRDSRILMKHSMNIIHLYHYNAMSLDHHMYFHTDVMGNGFDVVKDWLCFHYQVKRHANSRTLIRGHFFNKDNQAVATVVQEGLTYLFKGFADNAKL